MLLRINIYYYLAVAECIDLFVRQGLDVFSVEVALLRRRNGVRLIRQRPFQEGDVEGVEIESVEAITSSASSDHLFCRAQTCSSLCNPFPQPRQFGHGELWRDILNVLADRFEAIREASSIEEVM